MPTLSKKTIKISCALASVLLLLIGLFHGSGINYLSGEVQASNVSQLVKSIFPVLFISPSIQLIGISIIGILAVNEHSGYRILFTLSILVLINAVFAFWMNAIIPGVVLLTPSLIYLVAAWSIKNKKND